MHKPGLETDFPETGIFTRDQRALVDFDTEVAGTGISNYFAGVVVRAKTLSHEFVEAELLRPTHFNDSIHRRANRDPSNRCGDVVSRHGLNEHWRQSDGRTIARSISD